jgi:Pentapeptide repeats (8 copies)
MNAGSGGPGPDRAELRADCTRCAAVCCVALPFAASADFTFDKPAGEPCRHLDPGLRCRIHDRLRTSGFRGCAAYDCFGAGQRVTQLAFRDHDWRDGPEVAERMFGLFGAVRRWHELLWYLADALAAVPSGPLRDEVERRVADVQEQVRRAGDEVAPPDPSSLAADVDRLLVGVSEVVRSHMPRHSAGRMRPHADLAGAGLRGANLTGADLRGSCLIAADLRGANLSLADLRGADCRDTNLAGADLSRALFVVPAQVAAARGDRRTRLGPHLVHPSHWVELP